MSFLLSRNGLPLGCGLRCCLHWLVVWTGNWFVGVECQTACAAWIGWNLQDVVNVINPVKMDELFQWLGVFWLWFLALVSF